MNGKKRQLGLGVLGWIIATPFILLGLLIVLAIGYFIYCEANKAYWDAEIEKKCEKYGGVHIYEKTTITKEDIRVLGYTGGRISVPVKESAPETAPVYAKLKSTTVRKGAIKIRRENVKIIRRIDEKILGEYTSFSRMGGDFPTMIVYPSSFSCPKSEIILSSREKIFIVEEEK